MIHPIKEDMIHTSEVKTRGKRYGCHDSHERERERERENKSVYQYLVQILSQDNFTLTYIKL